MNKNKWLIGKSFCCGAFIALFSWIFKLITQADMLALLLLSWPIFVYHGYWLKDPAIGEET